MPSVKAKELSMEDILSSIRQIIADEGSSPTERQELTKENAVDDDFSSIDIDGNDELSAMENAPIDAVPIRPDYTASSDDTEVQATLVASNQGEEIAGYDAVGDELVKEISDPPAGHAPPGSETPKHSVLNLVSEDIQSERGAPQDMQADVVDWPMLTSSKLETHKESVSLCGEGLTAACVSERVKSSFCKLQRDASFASTSTIEGLMIEILRPMVKQWLDENLPQTVERMVEEEIKRIQGRD